MPPSRKFSRAVSPGPLWVGYSFALSASSLAVVAELYFHRLTGQRIPFLFGYVAVIASAAWAGPGPAVLTSLVTLGWASYFDLVPAGYSSFDVLTRCVIFSAECALLCAGSARMWRLMREAARSEAWHRQLVETAAEGIWVRDQTGAVAWANQRMADLLGLPLDKVIGRSLDDFLFPSDVWPEKTRREALRPGVREQFDRRLRRADGGELWLLTCCNRMADTPEEPGGMLDMMTDITERRLAEAALRKSEQRFRNLFEGVLEGVYQSTPDGRIISANPMLLSMLGVKSEAELSGIDAKNLFVDPSVRASLLDRLEREGAVQNIEYDLRRADGSVITVLENARVVRGDEGAVRHYEGTLTDITDRKRMEEQLRQAQKTEALGRLAGGIAHDFSNVLTVIGGYAKLALSELPSSHPAHPPAAHVVEATAGAMALTQQLLSFSRRSARAQTTDLNRVLRRAEPSLAAAHPGLVIVPSSERALVHARAGEIEQLAGDLVSALTTGVSRTARRPAVRIRTALLNPDPGLLAAHPELQPGLYVVLSAMLQPGTPWKPMREWLAGGLLHPLTGDLAGAPEILRAREIVKTPDGFLAAGPYPEGSESAAPLGLHAFLPCSDGAPSAGASESSGGETILLVEDEPLVRELSRDMLERQGYRVILAQDALEAERIGSRSQAFDLLIADADMPVMTGPELARRLRVLHPALKVLYIAGYSDAALKHDDMAISGSSQIEKPFSADALGRKVRQMLDRA